jgi:hypothetical protein
VSTFSLHCEKCFRDLNKPAARAMQLVALFKPSRFGRMAKTHPDEERHRCLHCGFVNVFHPVEAVVRQSRPTSLTSSWRDVSVKA